MTAPSAAGASVVATGPAGAEDQRAPSRSGLLLAAGLRALELGNREQAAAFLAALYREGFDLHYRELAGAFVAEAAR